MPCEMLILCGQVEKVEGRKSGVCGLIHVCVCVCTYVCGSLGVSKHMWEGLNDRQQNTKSGFPSLCFSVSFKISAGPINDILT